ncbi:MAG TPA: glutaredoxin family protein [Novimethylophilus sp.]|jgi:glutaredoxin|uniref:glutaredoxin family protein n=1 Tax=Novimethylophilus sp. TaxID=2137426 RepID=UPI002F40A6F3
MRFAWVWVLLAAVPAWAGDLYKWQAENGITRYSDQMPPPGAKNVQKLKSTVNALMAEKPAAALPDESRTAAMKHPITLYSFDDCGDPCKQAEAFLDKRGVPYTVKSSNADKAEMKKLTGKLEAPVIVFGNTAPIAGFEEGRWNRELDLAGYAKSNPYLKPGASMAIKSPPREQAPGSETAPGNNLQ